MLRDDFKKNRIFLHIGAKKDKIAVVLCRNA